MELPREASNVQKPAFSLKTFTKHTDNVLLIFQSCKAQKQNPKL